MACWLRWGPPCEEADCCCCLSDLPAAVSVAVGAWLAVPVSGPWPAPVLLLLGLGLRLLFRLGLFLLLRLSLFLLFRLSLLLLFRGLGIFFLFLLACVGRNSKSQKQKQCCCTDRSKSFHEVAFLTTNSCAHHRVKETRYFLPIVNLVQWIAALVCVVHRHTLTYRRGSGIGSEIIQKR